MAVIACSLLPVLVQLKKSVPAMTKSPSPPGESFLFMVNLSRWTLEEERESIVPERWVLLIALIVVVVPVRVVVVVEGWMDR